MGAKSSNDERLITFPNPVEHPQRKCDLKQMSFSVKTDDGTVFILWIEKCEMKSDAYAAQIWVTYNDQACLEYNPQKDHKLRNP